MLNPKKVSNLIARLTTCHCERSVAIAGSQSETAQFAIASSFLPAMTAWLGNTEQPNDQTV